ncbi:MAG: hypothetical protein JW894_16585 [Bacteroidales bacterium]|nr:hypothetical protein [Bacteroidales bacterium]
MKKIVKSGLIAAFTGLLIFMMTGVNAQRGYKGGGPGGPGGPGFRGPDSCNVQLLVYDMAEELGLNTEQEKEILQLHYDHIVAIKNINQEYKNDCVGERNARWELREKLDADVKKVLNADQQEKYDEFIKERKGPHGPRRKD